MGGFLNLDGLALTAEQGKWKRVAEGLGREVLGPRAAEVDATAQYPMDGLRALGRAGVLGLLVPKEHGGAGEGILTSTVVTEAIARSCASTAMAFQMHQSTIPYLCAVADDAQIERIIRPISRGEWIGAYAMSEPGSGNRIWHMDSRARPDGDGLVIDSLKSFCTSSGQADYYLVPVRSGASSTAKDLTLVVVMGNDRNIKPIGTWDGMGLRGNSSRPIHFDQCVIPKSQIMGVPDEGLSFMMAYSLPIYLCGLAACYVGIAQAAYDAAVAHVKKRVHSDTNMSLAHVETVQRLVAEMRIAIDVVRSTLVRVAQMADNSVVLFNEFKNTGLLDEVMRDNPNDPFFVELATLKPAACEMAIEVTSKAIQVCGGAAYKRGHIAERAYRDARAGSIMGPSDDTVKIVIGTQIMGLPQPWI